MLWSPTPTSLRPWSWTASSTRRSSLLRIPARRSFTTAAIGALALWALPAHAAPSPACHAPDPSQKARAPFDHYTMTSETIVANGVKREYKLAIPDNLDATMPIALVFGWHSLSANAVDARSMLDLESSARGQAIFVYPEAIYAPERDMVRWDLTADKLSPALGRGNYVALFDALIAAVGVRFCVDTSLVFAAGFSAGGFISNTLACYRPNSLRAIAAIAGKLEEPPEYEKTPCSSVPVAAFIAHGSGDGVVPLAAGKASRDHWLGLAQCAATSQAVAPAPCRAYDGCSEGHPVLWCEHQEVDAWGAHLVPSFAPKAMWSFFASFITTAPTPTTPAPTPPRRRPKGR